MRFVCNPFNSNDLRPAAQGADQTPPAGHSEAQPEGQGGGNTAVAEPTATSKAKTSPSKPRHDQLPPYQVLLHNDDINDMLYVVRTVIEITPLDKERALEVTFEAHLSGIAQVLVTHKERAELYRDQFQSKGLTTTIEPA